MQKTQKNITFSVIFKNKMNIYIKNVILIN